MSTESPQAAAAGETAQWQARLADLLSGVAKPELAQLTGQLSTMLGSRDAAGRLAPDAAILSSAKSELNQAYGQAQMGSKEAISYSGLRSGMGRTNPGAVGSAITSAATSLDRDRSSALRNLEFQSAQSSMADYNQVLQLLGQGTQASLGLAQGFSGAGGAAIGGLSNQSQMGSTLGGLSAGASLGAGIGSVVPGLGTALGGVIGGVAGGAAGYFGYGG